MIFLLRNLFGDCSQMHAPCGAGAPLFPLVHLLPHLDTVGWVIWPVPIWPILCWWDVKPYSINQSISNAHFVELILTRQLLGWVCSTEYDNIVQIFIFHNESGYYQRLGANASDTSVVIDNISKDVTYRSRILAYNHAGDGVLSDVVFVGKAWQNTLLLDVAFMLCFGYIRD